jgi:probable O-glycosylation ligase (exosortase A-associated)
MRDLLILCILVLVAGWSLRKPFVGAMAWTLTSLMSPHAEFGYAAANWPVGTVFAVVTLLGLLFTKERHNPFVGAASWWLLALVLWITITLPFSIFVDRSMVLWERSMKIFLMLFVSMALIDNRRKLEIFIWVNALAVGYYGFKGGAFTALTGGNYRVWGPGGFIEGNNELGLAVIVVVPLLRYLQLQMSSKWLRLGLGGGMGLCALMVLGTHSRGALVGIAAMTLVFVLKSEKKLLWGSLALAGGAMALAMMPEHWWARMNTIQTYQEDDSALGRLSAWGMAFNIANQRFTGGGFVMWTGVVFQQYGPIPDRVHAAHSIYFQALGEQGWVGLLLFLAVGAATWLAARDLIRIGRTDPSCQWAHRLGSMIQVSMVGYAAAGAFLSLTWFDLPYNIMAIAVLARHFARREIAATAAAAEAAATPAGPAGRGIEPLRHPASERPTTKPVQPAGRS